MAVMMITHDLGVVATMADDVLVMYAGRASEASPARTVFARPHHPYTRGLLGSIPATGGSGDGRLTPIVGQPPSLIRIPSGCAFHPRCPFAMDGCLDTVPDLVEVGGDASHRSACLLPTDITGLGAVHDARRQRYAEARRTGRAARLPGVVAAATMASAHA